MSQLTETEREQAAIKVLSAATAKRDTRRDCVSVTWIEDGTGTEIGWGDFGRLDMASSPRSRVSVAGIGEFDGGSADTLGRALKVFGN